ncbi:hypothetical protein ACIGXM_18665 [Kitasatospora sp. NPDC052896]|uniref:hypothetical protein n=1 Tax=Kitasatospora sp. NPDC052896 TaxID=3364061 RepID=UPI0037C578B1
MSLAFVRRLDGLTYHFRPDGTRNGSPCHRRVDLDLWLVRLPDRGWCTCDADGVANGWPLPSGAAHAALPPLTAWRSWKAGRSYLYDLRACGPSGC